MHPINVFNTQVHQVQTHLNPVANCHPMIMMLIILFEGRTDGFSNSTDRSWRPVEVYALESVNKGEIGYCRLFL